MVTIGWWETVSGSVIGDEPADILEEALERIRGSYVNGLGRQPGPEELKDLFGFCTQPEKPRLKRHLASSQDYLKRYPRLCAHIIAESLGYATPLTAATILKDAKEGNQNWCEWIDSCYNRDPNPAVQRAITNRHTHRGYMAEYTLALRIVKHHLETGEGPMLASWF